MGDPFKVEQTEPAWARTQVIAAPLSSLDFALGSTEVGAPQPVLQVQQAVTPWQAPEAGAAINPLWKHIPSQEAQAIIHPRGWLDDIPWRSITPVIGMVAGAALVTAFSRVLPNEFHSILDIFSEKDQVFRRLGAMTLTLGGCIVGFGVGLLFSGVDQFFSLVHHLGLSRRLSKQPNELYLEQQFPLLHPDHRELLQKLYPKGLHASHLKQKNVGDCYVLAALHTLKRNPIAPYLISRMISETPQGWRVHFFGARESVEVTNQDIEKYTLAHNEVGGFSKFLVQGDLGDRILVTAFGRLLAERERVAYQQARTVAVLDDGGWFDDVMKEMLSYSMGHTQHISNWRNTNRYYQNQVYQVLDEVADKPGTTMMYAAALVDQGDHGSNHAYSVLSVDKQKREVVISNPWNTKGMETVVSYEDFVKRCNAIQVTRLNAQGLIQEFGHLDFLDNRPREGVHGRLEPRVSYVYDLPIGSHMVLKVASHDFVIRREPNELRILRSGSSEVLYTIHQDEDGTWPDMVTLGRPTLKTGPDVSREHFDLQVVNGQGLMIRDRASTMGTYVRRVVGGISGLTPAQTEAFEVPKLHLQGPRSGQLIAGFSYAYDPSELQSLLIDDFNSKVTFEGFDAHGALKIRIEDGGLYKLSPGQGMLLDMEMFPKVWAGTQRMDRVGIGLGADGRIYVQARNSQQGLYVNGGRSPVRLAPDDLERVSLPQGTGLLISDRTYKIEARNSFHTFYLGGRDFRIQIEGISDRGRLKLRVMQDQDLFEIPAGYNMVLGRQNLPWALPSVSSKHLQIQFDGTYYYVTDKGSLNGTSLDVPLSDDISYVTAQEELRQQPQPLPPFTLGEAPVSVDSLDHAGGADEVAPVVDGGPSPMPVPAPVFENPFKRLASLNPAPTPVAETPVAVPVFKNPFRVSQPVSSEPVAQVVDSPLNRSLGDLRIVPARLDSLVNHQGRRALFGRAAPTRSLLLKTRL